MEEFDNSQKQLFDLRSQNVLQSQQNLISDQYLKPDIDEEQKSTPSMSSEQVKKFTTDSSQIQQEYLISESPFSKKSGYFSNSQIVLFKKKIVFIKQIVSKYDDTNEIYKNEKNIMEIIKGQDISLDLISYKDESFQLYLVAGDKDLSTIKEIIEDERFYQDSLAYDQFITNIYIQVLRRLRKFHNLGYCHLDIKPSNIMMGYNGQFYLADFGSSIELVNKQIGAYMTNYFNFKQYIDVNQNLSPEQNKQLDFSQLLLTILYMFVFDEESKEQFKNKEFVQCINTLLKIERNKNSEFLQNIKILVEYYQNQAIDSMNSEPDVYLEYLNNDMGLLDKLFDLQCSNQGIIFIKFIRDENLPLIDFLCKQNQIIELQNQCKIRTSCQLKDLVFLMEKLNIQDPQEFNLWQVDYKQKKKQQNKLNQNKIDQMTATTKQGQKVNFQQKTHDKLDISVVSISRSIENDEIKKNKLYNSAQINFEKQIDVAKQIFDAPKEIFDIIKYVITKVIIQIISYENEQEFKKQEFVYLDFSTYKYQRESLNYIYFNQSILKENTLILNKPKISNNESINLFIRKYQPFHLLQLIYQIYEETNLKYYKLFYEYCKSKEYFLFPIFLFEMADFLENNKSKIKIYLASFNDCIQRMNHHNNNLIPEIMQKLVDIFDNNDQFNKSLEYTFKINYFFEITQKCKNDEFVMRSKTNKAYAFMNVGKIRHSIQYFEEAITFGKVRTNIREINVVLSKAYNHLAFMLQLLKSYDLAYKCSKQSFKIRKQLVEENGSAFDQKQLGISYRNLGIIYIQLHEKPKKKIIQNFQRALELYVNCEDSNFFRLTLIDLSNALVKTEYFQNAQIVLNCAFIVYKTSSILIKQCIQDANLIYKQQKNLDKIIFSSKEEMLSYIEMMHKLIKEKVGNDQINQFQKNSQYERKINSLQEWQFELAYKRFKKPNERQKKFREKAIHQLEECAQNREKIFGEQYNMKIFKTINMIQKMCVEQELYQKALYYTRKMLQILLYLIQSDKKEIKNKEYPNFYKILIKQTLKEITALYFTVGKKELHDQYLQQIQQQSP